MSAARSDYQSQTEPADAPTEPATVSGKGPTDAMLVNAARCGERWAMEALFGRYSPLANGLAYRLLGSDQELDDVVQEAFYQALRSLHKLQDPQAFASWLASIVVRAAHRLLTRRRMLSRLGLRKTIELETRSNLAAVTASPEVLAEAVSIYSAVQRLPVDDRITLLLRRVEGYSIAQVSAAMGCSATTVKRRLARAESALEALRKEETP